MKDGKAKPQGPEAETLRGREEIEKPRIARIRLVVGDASHSRCYNTNNGKTPTRAEKSGELELNCKEERKKMIKFVDCGFFTLSIVVIINIRLVRIMLKPVT